MGITLVQWRAIVGGFSAWVNVKESRKLVLTFEIFLNLFSSNYRHFIYIGNHILLQLLLIIGFMSFTYYNLVITVDLIYNSLDVIVNTVIVKYILAQSLYIRRHLVLSGDIETNPGPPNPRNCLKMSF